VRLLLATFGVGVVSAAFPLVNMEVFITGLGVAVGEPNIWFIALSGGLGQAVGKIPWYEASRRSMDWGYIRKKMEKPKWKRRYDKVRSVSEERPWVGMAMLFSSALVAVPPLAITTVLAGQLRFSRPLFYLAIVVGRTLQFAALLGGVSWLTDR